MAERVAWVLGDGEEADVLFEESETLARVRYARNQGLDSADVTSRREPALDVHAPGPVPAAALLQLGWWLTCGECEHHVTDEGCWTCAEGEDGEGEGDPPAHVTDGTDTWCSAECRAATEARWRTRERATAAARAALPDCDVSTAMELSPTSAGWAAWAKVPGARHDVTFHWPSGVATCMPCDVPAVRFALGRDTLSTWESEGGRP